MLPATNKSETMKMIMYAVTNDQVQ